MRYPGGKNAGGAYQTVINQIPPHRVYIEPFLGSGAVARFKLSAAQSFLIDKDRSTVDAFNSECRRSRLDLTAHPGCGIDFLEFYKFRGDEFVYADPPYVVSATRSRRQIYSQGLGDFDHVRLLKVLKTITAPVAISGYASSLYLEELGDWRIITYPMVTRAGKVASECLWMNFPDPVALHDYRYLGSNKTERQQIRRKQKRWAAKLARMSNLERQALLAALDMVGGFDYSAGRAANSGLEIQKPGPAAPTSPQFVPATSADGDGFGYSRDRTEETWHK